MVQLASGGRYVFTNAKGGTVMDLSGADNRSVIGYPENGGDNQHWELEHTDEEGGGWIIRNVRTGLFLQLDGEPRDDTGVIGFSQPRVWHIWDDEDDPSTIRICVPGTRQNVDLSDFGNAQPGTPIKVWGRWEGSNQTWHVKRVD